jgi:hypothetical protein
MSNSNTRWIALAAIAVSLVLLVPVVVGQPASAPMHGDDPISTWADHAHEWMSGDATDHHAGGIHHAEGTHHTGHDHAADTGHDHAADTGHD